MSNRHLNAEGVGLGLAVSKDIAEALGGGINVESEEGVGSRFVFNLPVPMESDSSLQSPDMPSNLMEFSGYNRFRNSQQSSNIVVQTDRIFRTDINKVEVSPYKFMKKSTN